MSLSRYIDNEIRNLNDATDRFNLAPEELASRLDPQEVETLLNTLKRINAKHNETRGWPVTLDGDKSVRVTIPQN